MHTTEPKLTPRLNTAETTFIKNILVKRFLQTAPSHVIGGVSLAYNKVREAKLLLEKTQRDCHRAVENILDAGQ